MTLGVALLLTAAALAVRGRLRSFEESKERVLPHHPVYTILTGVFLGVIVSLSSVGAGALGISALFLLYPRMAAIRIIASDLAHAVPLTLVAGLGHWMYGSVDWAVLGSLLVGSLPGIYIGSHFAGHVPEKILRSFLAAMLALVGARMIAS
jgi:hypothetical protein